jgi:ribonucleoside-diphosphate reductase alpha chain
MNISVNFDDEWLNNNPIEDPIFRSVVQEAILTGEPGFSFNFGDKRNETLRNACCEITSEDDSDVCNLGSINLSQIESIHEFTEIVRLGTLFLLCGTFVSDVPYEKVAKVRNKNRRLGLGLMGIHEWLLLRGYRYEVVPELHAWLEIYKNYSWSVATRAADSFGVSRPVAVRAIAPTGTIGMLAGTTTGIEPIYAVAYRRTFANAQNNWESVFHIDSTAQQIIDRTGIDPDKIETAMGLSYNVRRRIQFQADIQDYVDHGISSTVNLPSSSERALDNESLARAIVEFAPRLRGLTFYPNGARGGQPLIPAAYTVAKGSDREYNDVCEIAGGGICGA